MRVLITGVAGFIGSHLAEALTERGDQVWGFDNFATGRKQNWPETEEIDLFDRHRVYAYANGIKPDLVIHCAASYKDPDKWHVDTDTNVAGGINAALVAKHHGARLIYFQTILPPISSYAISKIASEHYQRLSGVPLTVLRLANIYGPRNLSGPIPVFYKRLTEGKSCVVVDTTREMVYIDDLVRCVLMVIEQGQLWKQATFDVCTGQQIPIMNLFSLVCDALGMDEDPSLIPPDPDDVQGHVYPYRGVPGWKATTPLRDGVEETVASYREYGVTDTHTHLKIGQ